MSKVTPVYISLFLLILSSLTGMSQERGGFQAVAPQYGAEKQMRLKTNFIPWALAIPNVGMEYVFAPHWSTVIDVWFCPWKISDKFSVKTAAVLPEARWWVKHNRRGSFLNLHLNIAWFNVRANSYRYQDKGTPLLGGGIGYGYRCEVNNHWGFEFEIGAGISYAKYHRYYNINNGAFKDTRTTTYFGIDRAAISVTYNL